MGYQKIIIMGNLGRDPEYRSTATGKGVTNFSVAVTEKSGANESTEWFRCTAWDKTAEIARDYLHKGDGVLVEGRLKTSEYTDKNGEVKKSTDLMVDRISFVGGKKDGDRQQGGARSVEPENRTGKYGDGGGGYGARVPPQQPPTDDDIPF